MPVSRLITVLQRSVNLLLVLEKKIKKNDECLEFFCRAALFVKVKLH